MGGKKERGRGAPVLGQMRNIMPGEYKKAGNTF
jgi:hypothetical protein